MSNRDYQAQTRLIKNEMVAISKEYQEEKQEERKESKKNYMSL